MQGYGRVCRKVTGFFIWIVCMVVNSAMVFAAMPVKQDIVVSVSDYFGAVEQLRICYDENMHDDGGNVVASKDDMVEAVFETDGDTFIAEVQLYDGIRYYVSDGVDQVSFVAEDANVDLSFDGGISGPEEDAMEDTNEEDAEENTGMEVSAQMDEINVGDSVKCIVSQLTGSKDKESDTFLLQCEIPEGMDLETVYTGTYSHDVSLTLLCKTEDENKWHIWGENISSKKGDTFYTTDISLADGDRISAFAVSAEEIPQNFSLNENDPCYYKAKVTDEDAVREYKGMVKVSAYVDSKKESESTTYTTTTTVIKENQNVVKTGDENIILVGSFILLIISVLTLFSYIVVRIVLYKREERIEKEVLPVKFSKYTNADTSEKMSSLLSKKPG